MKTKLFLLATLLMALAGGLRGTAQTLVIHHPDGTTTDVELFTQPHVEFQGDKVLITSPVLDIEYPKEQVLSFTYKGKMLSGINAPTTEADVNRDGNQLVFHGIGQRDKMAVYTANGIRVPVRLTRNGDHVTLPLSQIPQGVCLISINGRTSKFTRP